MSPAWTTTPRARRPRSCGTRNSTARFSATRAGRASHRLGTDDPERLRRLPAHASLEYRDGGRPRPVPGSVPRRHPPRRLPAPAAPQSAAPSSRQSADCRRRRRGQDRRGRPCLREMLLRRRVDFVARRRAGRHGPPVAGRTGGQFGLAFHHRRSRLPRRPCGASAATAPARGPRGRASSFRIRCSPTRPMSAAFATSSATSGRARCSSSTRRITPRPPAARATRSTASSPARSAASPIASSTGSSCRRRRTTATPTRSRRCSRSSTRNASPAASPVEAARTRPSHGPAAEIRPPLFRREIPGAAGRADRHFDGLPSDAPELVLVADAHRLWRGASGRARPICRPKRRAMSGSPSSACSSACSPRSRLSPRRWRCIAGARRAPIAARDRRRGGLRPRRRRDGGRARTIEAAGERSIQDEEDQAAEAAGALGAPASTDLALVDEMLEHRPQAAHAARRPRRPARRRGSATT